LKKIVVLTDFSLLAQGITSRLRESSQIMDVVEIDFRKSGVLEKLIKLKPQVVIFGSKDANSTDYCPLDLLFDALPNLLVIEVNQNNSNIQLIRGNQYNASNFSDFMRLLENSNETNNGILAAI